MRSLLFHKKIGAFSTAWQEPLPLWRFAQEYLQDCLPAFSKEEQELYQLAREFDEGCESFDRRVCSVRSKRGTALPANSHEMRMICQHANRLFDEMLPQVYALGFGAKEFHDAIREVQK
jgi:hypothetical protein